MKNNAVFKRLIISLTLVFIAGLALSFVTTGGKPSNAVGTNTVYFAKTYEEITDRFYTGYLPVEIVVTGTPGETVSFDYHTEGGTAITGIDFRGVSQSAVVKIGQDGSYRYRAGIQCLNNYATRERLRVTSGDKTYGRYFNVVIDNVKNAVLDEERDTCKCFLQYDSKVSATTGIVTDSIGGSREVAYFDDYTNMQALHHGGKGNLDGRKTWKSWESGVSFVNDTTTHWLNSFVNGGFASAYGSYLFRYADNSEFHSSTDIYALAGNKEFMSKYDGVEKDIPGMYLYLGFEPKRSGLGLLDGNAEKLNGRAMYLISIGEDPYDEDSDYIQVNSSVVSSEHKRVYWYQDGDAWYAKDKTFTDSVFFRINPYAGILDNGLAIWNKNKEVDISFKDLWFFMTLIDDTCPTIIGEYVDDSRFLSEGKLRFYIRFSEPVYASRISGAGERRPIEIKINNLAKPYYADYVEGNYTDTLVYEINAEDLPKTNIKSIRYQLPTNDIGDMAYNLNSYKVVENNKVQNTDQIRTFTMLNGAINYFKPNLTIDKDKSNIEKNIYNLTLSINADEKAEGTIYYEWSNSDTKENKENGSAYQNAYVLNEEDSGSIGITLVKDEKAGIISGTYYLHAYAVSPYGLKDYKCFGPYKLDGDPPNISLSTPTNALKTKVFELDNSKVGGASLLNISLVLSWTDLSGHNQTAKRVLLENGERTTALFTVLTENQKYQYASNIDDTVSDPLDDFILGIMGESMRFDVSVCFEVEDIAGNKSETPAMRVVYDKRNVFKVDSSFPSEQGYIQITDVSTLYNAYDISNVNRSEGKGISISIRDDDRNQIVHGETAFSVTVNGESTYSALDSDPYTVIIGDLEAGFYELVPTITGETGGALVELVSNPICFYLTNGKKDNTVNKMRTQEDMVFTNRVFLLDDVRYYYLDSVGSAVSSHLYGATFDSVLNKYNGGSSTPAFSNITEAKKYVRFMEYQDLYLVMLTPNMASLLNSSSGSTTYMKAEGETVTAQEGQLWIRYKRSSWSSASNAYGWAYYYYGNGSLSTGINITSLSANLNNAINTVVNRIVSVGESTYLVQDGQIDQRTGAPYLASTQIHVASETADCTKTGIPFVVNLSYEGDANLYKNNVTVDGSEYPLATNLIISKNDNTELYYRFGESTEWTRLNIQNGQRLYEALTNNVSGIYTIREYGDFGVCEFMVYYDKTLPTLELTINGEQHYLDGSILGLSGATTAFTALRNEVDDLAYVAIYSYPSRDLQTVLYKSEVSGYTLESGNYYIQVGDRAGNIATYTLLLSTSTLEVTAEENDSGTAVVVRVLNRTESEIYTYEVYLNEELLTNEFDATKVFKDSGVYRIVVSDIYGNYYSETIEHSYQVPKITWYYLNSSDSYSKYDENNISKMIVSMDANNSRITNVYTSTLIRIVFDLNFGNSDIKFEMLDIDPSFYTYSESTGVLSINVLTGWRLRVWYEDHPENDHIYACQLDTDAPTFDASFIGKVFSLAYSPESLTQEDLANIGEGNAILPNSLGYDTDNKTASYALFNGSVIEGNHIAIKLFDPSGIRSYNVTRNGQSIAMSLDSTGSLLINSYGSYVITATDNLGNTSTFSFVNTKDSIAPATMGEDEIKNNTIVLGHEPLIVSSKYLGDVAFLFETIDNKKAHYVFNFDGNVVTYGSYSVGIETDDDETGFNVYIAEFVIDSGFALSLSDDSVSKNRWYQAIDTDDYTIYVMFDAQSCAVYKVESKQREFSVSVLASVGNGKIPNCYTAKMSQDKTDITIYVDGFETEIAEDVDCTYVAGTLTLEESGITGKYPMVERIEVAFSETLSFDKFDVVYLAVYESESDSWSVDFKGFEGAEDGYYQFVVYNVFGNVTTYTVCKVESFTTIVTARYQDNTDNVYREAADSIIRSNKEISLLVFSDNVHFVVNDEEYDGIKTRATTELVLNMPGTYNVRVVAANGIYQEYGIEIATDHDFAFQEEWLSGYNENALLRDQGYTNRPLTVELADSVKYVEVVYNNELTTVVYDELSENKITDTELLKSAIGTSGNGVYVVNFRDKYGDVVSKTIHFSILPSVSIYRKTLAKQNEWEKYSWGLAILGVYSNYQIMVETTSSLYEFRINDNIVSLDEPRIFEFNNTSGNGTYEYKISFIDEYGNYLQTRLILKRDDVEIDKPQMREVTIGDTRYTKDNVVITFAKSFIAYVSIDGAEPVSYKSGKTFYKDGNYRFIVEDIAGNRLEYTIVHKSVNYFTLTDRANELPIVNGSVINNSAVVFRAEDDSTIKTLVKNGNVVKDYEGNIFSSTGHYEILVEDSVGNQTYAEFYIVNNSLGKFEYTAPYGYEIKELWFTDAQGDSKIIETEKDAILLDQNGDYVVLVAGKEILSSFRFTVTIDSTPPSAIIEGVENGGTTARNVTIKGLKVGDQVTIYKNGVIAESFEVSLSTETPEIASGGDYRIVITNVQGVSTEYTFTRKKIANTATSIFIIMLSAMLITGIGVGLLYHTIRKTDA